MRDPKDIVNHMQELDSLGKDTDRYLREICRYSALPGT